MANFNEIFDTVKEKVTQGAQAASQKTKDLTAIAKANDAIKNEESKIRKAETELGKLYYADYTVGSTPEGDAYTPWCEKITEAKAAIEEQKALIEALKAKKEEAAGNEPDVVVEITEADLVEETEDGTAEEAAEETETTEEE